MVCFSVDIMRKKLDSENLGIILLNAFMDEFFPKEESSTPDMFNLYHYNGLAQSNIDGQVIWFKYLLRFQCLPRYYLRIFQVAFTSRLSVLVFAFFRD